LRIPDVQSFRAADFDTDHCLVVVAAEVTDGLAVNKQRSQGFLMERFKFNKLNMAECNKEILCCGLKKVSSLGRLGAEVEINSAWKMIRENIKISAKEILGYFESKKHKP
jgi:hypothetical protein